MFDYVLWLSALTTAGVSAKQLMVALFEVPGHATCSMFGRTCVRLVEFGGFTVVVDVLVNVQF